MPRRKGYRKRKVIRRKRRAGPRRGGGRGKAGPYTMVNRGPSFLPDVYKTMLRFTQRVALAGTSGSIALKIFRGNSAYDPDFASGGESPVGFQPLSKLYNLYRVDASSISITAYPSTVNYTDAAHRIVLIPMPILPTTPAEIVDIAGMTYAKESTQGYGAEKALRLRSYMTLKKMFNRRVVNDLDFQATIGLSPAYQWYWAIYATDWDQTSDWAMTLEVKMKFWVTFSERQPIDSGTVFT